MYATTITAMPFSYSKACDTFRPLRRKCAARRTGLGGKTFAHFFEPCAMLNSLVRQFYSEGRPTRIEYRFRHVGFCETGGIYIADCDVIKFSNDAIREFVLKVVSSVGDLCVYRPDTTFFAGLLRDCQGLFSASIDALRLDFFTGGQSSEVFQAKVDAYATNRKASISGFSLNIDHDVQEPVASRVARKVSSIPDLPIRKRAAIKNAEGVPSKAKGLPLTFQTLSFQRDPRERALAPISQERTALLCSAFRVLLTHGIDSSRVQTEFFITSACKVVQIKTGEPLPTEPQCVLLPIVTVIPNKITCLGLPIQQPIQ